MIARHTSTLITLLALAACGGTGPGSNGPTPTGAAPLAYGPPVPEAVTYAQSDTVRVSVDAGGQTFAVNQIQSSLLGMSFRDTPAGVEVTTVFTDFEGTVDNPMTGQQRFTEEAIDGPLVWTLDRRGGSTLVAEPEMTGAIESLVNPESIALTFFPRLPDRVVTAGDAWTDTINVDAEAQGGVIRLRSVVEYTVRGDTVVDGVSHLRVDFVSDDARTAEVSESGMDIVQDVAGTSRGHFLWDRARNRLHSQVQSASYTGTMEVPQAPFPLGLTIDATSRLVVAAGSPG